MLQSSTIKSILNENKWNGKHWAIYYKKKLFWVESIKKYINCI